MAIKMDDLVQMLQQLSQQGGSTQDFFKQLIQATQGQTNPLVSMLTSDNGPLQSQLSNQQNAFDQSGAPVSQINGPSPINLPDFTSEGLTPDAMAALTGSNIDRQSQAFDTQGRQLTQALASRGIFGGGSQPGSGLAVDPLAALASQKAQANSQAVRDAIMENQKQLYLNRANLSLPARQQALQAQISNNGMNMQAQTANSDNELKRRNLVLQALQGGNSNINSLSSLLNALNGPLSSFVSGLGVGANQQNTSLQQQGSNKQAALQNDVATGPMSVLGPLIGAGAGVASAALMKP